jgi:hypothetical protein
VWQPGGIFRVLLQWDAELWYVTIARQGYTFDPDFPSSMGFFPFYPIVVIRLFSLLFEDMRVAAIVGSHVCFVGAALLFNALINVDYKDQRVNRAAITLLMFSPVSFFFSHAYTESTFMLLSLGAFLAAIRGKWLIACICGGCLTATRNVGMLIALPLFVEYVRQVWRPGVTWRELLHPRILLFAIIPPGFGLFSLYSYLKFGTPFAYLAATRVWGREFVAPWQTLANVEILPDFYRAFFISILISGLVLFAAGVLLPVARQLPRLCDAADDDLSVWCEPRSDPAISHRSVSAVHHDGVDRGAVAVDLSAPAHDFDRAANSVQYPFRYGLLDDMRLQTHSRPASTDRPAGGSKGVRFHAPGRARHRLRRRPAAGPQQRTSAAHLRLRRSRELRPRRGRWSIPARGLGEAGGGVYVDERARRHPALSRLRGRSAADAEGESARHPQTR